MKNLLLPYRFKFAGFLLLCAGSISAFIYILFDFKFKMPVFAVYSSYLDTKMFKTITTNISEELTLLLLISGFALIIFSREKNEYEGLDSLRLKAFARAMILNIIFLLFSVLFVYGTGFIGMLVFNVLSFFIFYLFFFYLQKRART